MLRNVAYIDHVCINVNPLRYVFCVLYLMRVMYFMYVGDVCCVIKVCMRVCM